MFDKETLMMIDGVCGWGICILGVLSAFLIARKNKLGLYAALAAQPCWIFTTAYNQQWGILILSFALTINWFYGIRKWSEDERGKKDAEKPERIRYRDMIHSLP